MTPAHVDHDEDGPVDHHKHLQLGVDPDTLDDERECLSEDERDAAWETATTVEDFKAGIEELRKAGWPVGSDD